MTGSSSTLRLDPSPSRVFSWMEWEPNAPVLLDEETQRTIRPASPLLRVRYRSTGAEWEFWPVSEEEARRVMQPGKEFDFSIGRAFGDIIKSHKSGRLVRCGERKATRKQREGTGKQVTRRWMA